ncbi:unnamed protein product [Vitrella brassicaformis CCMP3155]|uniref:Protein phosphatase n=1 Tax=Vitrella brassicaformis (strain CCMP3155) TaxID=1169540 RepID=A0A0G4EXG5_VITBC|nr:unnamed protein product [Vitrella brassicaformis CCMP3155]|eukprot:CEM03386.1 unnamed protein product [Vitrella brassicaformis CCMP3155]
MQGCGEAATFLTTAAAADGSPMSASTAAADTPTSAALPAESGSTYLSELLNDKELPVEQQALRLLQHGYSATRSCGASTALVVVMDKQGDKLGVANLGDCSMMVLRSVMRRVRSSDKLVTVAFRAKEQQHSPNEPYQLMRLPEETEYDRLTSSGRGVLVQAVRAFRERDLTEDTPDMAKLESVNVCEGDLIILGSDAVFDNLGDTDILNIGNMAISPYDALSVDAHRRRHPANEPLDLSSSPEPDDKGSDTEQEQDQG